MGRCTIMLDGKFMEWTSISDGPSSLLLTEEQFRIYWRQEYGRNRWHDLAEVLIKAKANGSTYGTVNEIISGNHAGENGKTLTKKQIIEAYTPENEADFLQWCKNRDKFAEKQYADYEKIFSERIKKTS